jgi:dTDP-4-dehydrorhamnose reductase
MNLLRCVSETDYTPSMTWAVVGSLGMFGSDMLKVLETSGPQAKGFNRDNLDLADSVQSLARELSGSEFVLNAVAYTKVDLAEVHQDSAQFANAEVPRKLAEACKLSGSRLIHISTDYVFAGESKTPYPPDSQTNPKSVYGTTKLEGEDAVLAFENTQVVRTAWLYGANGPCFPKTIASRLLVGKELSVVDDQFGSPTHTLDLANFVLALGRSHISERVLHGVSSGSASWFGFAQEIAANLGVNGDLVQPTSTANFPTSAKRPANSVLEPSEVNGYQIPTWQQGWHSAADLVLKEIKTT